MTAPLQFKIPDELFQQIENEFNCEALSKRYAETKNLDVFKEFGQSWMKRTIELGKMDKYMDHTYEMIKQVAEKFNLNFPNEPQRFIEIANLSIHAMSNVYIYTSNRSELSYKILSGECNIYRALKENLTIDELKEMPCKSVCMEALHELFPHFGFDVTIEMLTTMAQNGECFFKSQLK